MGSTSRATHLRRRAVALLGVACVVAGIVALLRGGDPEPAAPVARARPAPAGPRTDVAAVAARANVPVLCWHQIRPFRASDTAQDRTYIVPPRVLDAQLGALQRAGYTSVSAAQVAAHLAEGKPLPRRPVLLSFDDGTAGQATRALPLLRRHGFTATFFVMTVVLGKPDWLSRAQVRALDRAGMEIGGHTWDHRSVAEYGPDDWARQLDAPKAELESIVGHRIDAFAYPFGIWRATAFDSLRRAGFRIAFQLAEKGDPAAPMLTVRRVLVPPDTDGPGVLRLMREAF